MAGISLNSPIQPPTGENDGQVKPPTNDVVKTTGDGPSTTVGQLPGTSKIGALGIQSPGEGEANLKIPKASSEVIQNKAGFEATSIKNRVRESLLSIKDMLSSVRSSITTKVRSSFEKIGRKFTSMKSSIDSKISSFRKKTDFGKQKSVDGEHEMQPPSMSDRKVTLFSPSTDPGKETTRLFGEIVAGNTPPVEPSKDIPEEELVQATVVAETPSEPSGKEPPLSPAEKLRDHFIENQKTIFKDKGVFSYLSSLGIQPKLDDELTNPSKKELNASEYSPGTLMGAFSYTYEKLDLFGGDRRQLIQEAAKGLPLAEKKAVIQFVHSELGELAFIKGVPKNQRKEVLGEGKEFVRIVALSERRTESGESKGLKDLEDKIAEFTKKLEQVAPEPGEKDLIANLIKKLEQAAIEPGEKEKELIEKLKKLGKDEFFDLGSITVNDLVELLNKVTGQSEIKCLERLKNKLEPIEELKKLGKEEPFGWGRITVGDLENALDKVTKQSEIESLKKLKNALKLPQQKDLKNYIEVLRAGNSQGIPLEKIGSSPVGHLLYKMQGESEEARQQQRDIVLLLMKHYEEVFK